MPYRRHDWLLYAVVAAAGAVWWWVRPRDRYGPERTPAAAAGAGTMHFPAGASQPIRLGGLKWIGPVLALLVAAFSGAWAYHEHRVGRQVDIAVGGVAARAIPIMLANGCAGCHTIPGVPGAQGQVGPRLDATLSSRRYLAGVLPNSKENMIRWLRASRRMVPHTTMPSTGISEQQARDVAAYLYALR